LTTCPQQYIGDVVDALQLSDLFFKGIPPVAGGALDQSAWFIQAARTMKLEDARVKEELQK
jgi:hypothetical protein